MNILKVIIWDGSMYQDRRLFSTPFVKQEACNITTNADAVVDAHL